MDIESAGWVGTRCA